MFNEKKPKDHAKIIQGRNEKQKGGIIFFLKFLGYIS